MEYPTPTRSMDQSYASNNYDGAAVANYAMKEREPIFQRVDKQIEDLLVIASDTLGKAESLANRIARPMPTNPNVHALGASQPRPPQGIVDEWSEKLTALRTRLLETSDNLSRIGNEL